MLFHFVLHQCWHVMSACCTRSIVCSKITRAITWLLTTTWFEHALKTPCCDSCNHVHSQPILKKDIRILYYNIGWCKHTRNINHLEKVVSLSWLLFQTWCNIRSCTPLLWRWTRFYWRCLAIVKLAVRTYSSKCGNAVIRKVCWTSSFLQTPLPPAKLLFEQGLHSSDAVQTCQLHCEHNRIMENVYEKKSNHSMHMPNKLKNPNV